jgi:hypothetical protein
MIDLRHNRRAPDEPEAVEAITALAAVLTAEIDGLFSRFRLSEWEADELLREILFLAVLRWDQIESREVWMLAWIRRACIRRACLRRSDLRHRGRRPSPQP